MNSSGHVDHDAVLRARTTLLGSGELTLCQKIEAYRVLADVSPLTYRPKLTYALVLRGFAAEFRDRPDVRLALFAEAVAVARGIGAQEPKGTQLLGEALYFYQRELFDADRPAEGQATREELTEVGLRGFERGQEPYRGLATVLAEEGRHREAALVLEEAARETSSSWSAIERAAALDAAGLRDQALEAFAEVVGTGRRALADDGTPLASVAMKLLQHSRMLDAAGRGGEAGAARAEALGLLAELARSGERRGWGSSVPLWAVLFALSGRVLEPAAAPGAPAPAFGTESGAWSRHVRRAYLEAVPALEARAGSLGPAERVTVHRRLTIRKTLLHGSHHLLPPPELRPLFDEGVALARRLGDEPGRGGGKLATALTDRCLYLLTARHYAEAHADLLEAAALPVG
ncbi:hypothetical protein OOK31_01625 [Streptomyces sp. NBC_00249]|uniref:hypothetical protein n=1 Tax=Streptomyces sp. NBC_00249 TaxID=2975690 RepID=UPI00224FADD9|nr:hypothetical protein [Streptomyces sp. NBC_00249]MCX5192600.1 hypothetical protein [Streptomyces sp. NBC_00249]